MFRGQVLQSRAPKILAKYTFAMGAFPANLPASPSNSFPKPKPPGFPVTHDQWAKTIPAYAPDRRWLARGILSRLKNSSRKTGKTFKPH